MDARPGSMDDLEELVDCFVLRPEGRGVVVTDEFRDELRHNMRSVSHLSEDSDELKKLALVYSLVRVFEPIHEEKLLKYIRVLLPLTS